MTGVISQDYCLDREILTWWGRSSKWGNSCVARISRSGNYCHLSPSQDFPNQEILHYLSKFAAWDHFSQKVFIFIGSRENFEGFHQEIKKFTYLMKNFLIGKFLSFILQVFPDRVILFIKVYQSFSWLGNSYSIRKIFPI